MCTFKKKKMCVRDVEKLNLYKKEAQMKCIYSHHFVMLSVSSIVHRQPAKQTNPHFPAVRTLCHFSVTSTQTGLIHFAWLHSILGRLHLCESTTAHLKTHKK